jgi:hypothetical protein
MVLPCVRRRSCGRTVSDAELLADIAHSAPQGVNGAVEDAASGFAIAQRIDDGARRLGQPDSVALGILGAGPLKRRHWLTGQLPP